MYRIMTFTKIFLKYEVLRVIWTYFYLFPGLGRHFVNFVTTVNLLTLINIIRLYIIFTNIYYSFKQKVTYIIKIMIICVHLIN